MFRRVIYITRIVPRSQWVTIVRNDRVTHYNNVTGASYGRLEKVRGNHLTDYDYPDRHIKTYDGKVRHG